MGPVAGIARCLAEYPHPVEPLSLGNFAKYTPHSEGTLPGGQIAYRLGEIPFRLCLDWHVDAPLDELIAQSDCTLEFDAEGVEHCQQWVVGICSDAPMHVCDP